LPLAWIAAQKLWFAPFPGTTKLSAIEDTLGSADLVLTPAQVAKTFFATAAIPINGARHPDHFDKATGLQIWRVYPMKGI